MPQSTPNTLPSPGTYLRTRRLAQRLSIEDVASFVRTEPPLGHAARADLLRSVEADIAPIGDDVIASLLKAREMGSFRFDGTVLVALIRHHTGTAPCAPPRLCRICACSEHDPCFDEQPGKTCCWLEADLCSACGPDDSESDEPLPFNDPVHDPLQLRSAA